MIDIDFIVYSWDFEPDKVVMKGLDRITKDEVTIKIEQKQMCGLYELFGRIEKDRADYDA